MNSSGLKLGVNVDHVATLRQARGTPYPSPIEIARSCMNAGAQSITVHLREDRRHIQDADVYAVSKQTDMPINLEMAVADDIVAIALEITPEEICLVPEKRQEITTEGGLDVAGNLARIKEVTTNLQAKGVCVSLFVEANPKQLDASAATGAKVVELHTGSYCDAPDDQKAAELQTLIIGARYAHNLGLQVNAGHGINLETIDAILHVPHLDTLNIGHSIIARALYVGIDRAVQEMLEAMNHYTGGNL